MSRKVLVVLSCVLLLTFALSSSASAKKVSLNFWNGFTGPDGRFMQKLVDQFNADHPDIQVKMNVIPWGDYYNKIVTAVPAGKAPDIGIMHLDRITEFASRGVLHPLDVEMLRQGLRSDDFVETVWKAGLWEGKRYGAPLDIHPLTMYWNRQIFKEAGFDPDDPPENRAEFMDYAKKTTIDKDGEGKNDQWGTMWSVGWPNFFCWWVVFFGNDGKLFSEDNSKCLANSPEGVEALQFLVDNIYVDKISPPNVQIDADIDAFKRGELAMEFNGIWMLTAYMEQPGLDFFAGPVPQLGMVKKAAWAGSHNFVIPRQRKPDPDKIRAAGEFINWITSHSLEWAKAGQLPARLSVLNSPEFQALEYHASIAKMASYVVFPPLFPKYGEAIGPIWDAINLALLGKKTAEEALNEAVDRSNKILAAP